MKLQKVLVLSTSESQYYMSLQCYEPKCECQLFPKIMKKVRFNIIDYMQQRCGLKNAYIKTQNVPACQSCGKTYMELPEKRSFSKFQSLTVLSLDPINGLETGLFVLVVDNEYVDNFQPSDLLKGLFLFDQIYTDMNFPAKEGNTDQKNLNKKSEMLLANQDKTPRISGTPENLFIAAQLEKIKHDTL